MRYRYQLQNVDGRTAGVAEYAAPVHAGDVIWSPRDGRKLRVLDLLPAEDSDDTDLAGRLRVAIEDWH